MILGLVLTSVLSAQESNTSVSRPFLPGFLPSSLPKILLEYSPIFHSNIDKLNTPIYDNLLGHKLSVKTRLRGKPFKKLTLIDLPKIDGEYTPAHFKKLRSLNIYNSLIGLYLPFRGLSFNSVLTTGYSDFISMNEDNELEQSNFYSVGLNGGVNYAFSKKVFINLDLGAKIQDYLRPPTPIDDFTNDNVKFLLKLAPKLKLGRGWQIVTDFRYSKKFYREKRALTKTGVLGGIQADTIDQYKIIFSPKFKDRTFSLYPSFAYLFNRDMQNGGRTYEGPDLSLKFRYNFDKLKYNSKVRYTHQSYDTQLVNTSLQEGETLKNHLWSMEHTISFKFNNSLDIIPGYEFSKLDSNRENDNYNDHSIRVGMNLTI